VHKLKIFLLIFLCAMFYGIINTVKFFEHNDLGGYLHIRGGLYKFGEFYWLRYSSYYIRYSKKCFGLHLERCKGKPIYVAEYKILKGQFVFSDLLLPEDRKFLCFGHSLYLIYAKEGLYHLLIEQIKRRKEEMGKSYYFPTESDVYFMCVLKLYEAFACEKLGYDFEEEVLRREILKDGRVLKRVCGKLREGREEILSAISGKRKAKCFSVSQFFLEDALRITDWSLGFLGCSRRGVERER